MTTSPERPPIERYFDDVVYRNEHYPICVVGAGQAGTEIASAFRLKPHFIGHYLPELYPVRAATFDTQSTAEQTSDWEDSRLQRSIQLPEHSRIPEILERAPLRDAGQTLTDLAWANQVGSFESGGAGGRAIRGRAAALLNLFENDQKQRIQEDLGQLNYLSREHPGYLLSCSSLGGGTGSGFAPVVVKYLHQLLIPHPTATYSLCVVPEDAATNDRTQMNQLIGSYYMVSSQVINGIILSDNRQLGKQGITAFSNIDRYLQEVLMPILLAPLPAYTFGIEMDPANVMTVLQPNPQGPEFIVMCFSRISLATVGNSIQKAMKYQTIETSNIDDIPEFEELVEKALECPTVDFIANSAVRCVGLVSGPPDALEDLGFLEPITRDNYQRILGNKTLTDSDQKTDCRLFAAKFDNMDEIRLTILLSGATIPSLETNINTVLELHNTPITGVGSLADRLRMLPEESIRNMSQVDLNKT